MAELCYQKEHLPWVVTDVDILNWNIREVYIRPAAVLSIGLRLGIVPNIVLVGDVRAKALLAVRKPARILVLR